MFENKTLTNNDIKLLKEKYPTNYNSQIEKIKNGYPVQYLIGDVPFLNTTILVNENVLIPRFETEYLVEKILKKMKDTQNIPLRVLDIGTGSGCISIALAKNTNWKCLGIDISQDALKVAEENNKKNNTNVIFKQKDILNENLENEYDIIVSNPPYIGEYDDLDKSTKYEPQIALFAENKGLIFYEQILTKIKNKPKLIAFEIGETQGDILLDLAKNKFPKAKITIEKDLCNKERFLFISNE